MSIGLVCTLHKKSLLPAASLVLDDDGNYASLEMVCDFTEDQAEGVTDHYHEFTISLDRWVCPANKLDEVTARRVQGQPEEYQKALEKIDCSRWHAAVNLDTGEPLDESFDRSIHINWEETEIYR